MEAIKDNNHIAKVGILTITHTCNYGAELQAYALSRAIEGLGWPCELVDYSCPHVAEREIPHAPQLRGIRHPRNYLRTWLNLGERKQKHKAFLAFEDEFLKYGPKVSDEQEVAERYGMVVVGSDQVWNGPVTGGDHTFLLNDPSCDGTRKLAYAASFGDTPIGENDQELYRQALGKFEAIGTRESSGVSTVESLGISGARCVLDPTLLLTAEEWRCVAAKSSVEGPYVLVYTMADVNRTVALAKQEAERLGIPLVAVNLWSPRLAQGAILRNDASPAEFLGLVDGAELVVTSSFHGTCFSVLFEKNFRCVLKEGVDKRRSRIFELLDALGLESRCHGEGCSLNSIGYAEARCRLLALRKSSLDFLSTALRNSACGVHREGAE